MNSNSPICRLLEKRKVPPPRRSVREYNELGYKVPKPLPEFVVTSVVEDQVDEVAVRMCIGRREPGRRVIGWYGPPGTGKNTLAREIAAALEMPFEEFDLGHGYDLLELIGGTGLRAEGGATKTAAIEGPLTRAARDGCIIAINEIVNVDGIQLSILHAMIQERHIRLPTAEGYLPVDVDPDTFFIFTWNPDPRNPERQMPPPALMERMRPRRFPEDSPEDEALKLVSFLKRELGRHYSPEEVRKEVQLIRELRRGYILGELARCPYLRTLEDFAITLRERGEAAAFRVLLNLCDQDPDLFEEQKDYIERHFRAYFALE